ncbi:MAG TPA: N-acetylglucosamine-6-phosphate deacetylase, partial [Candidatus Hydrogenedentes bacterium]|nr:N-acetylglucosamine-6-phosphate deacetylase [Candidatus Hydrogenedentota bacterium]
MSQHDFVIRGRFPDSIKAVDVRLHAGKVISVTRAGRGAVDVGDDECIFAPPLFDIQVNGGFGIDLQSHNVTVEQIRLLNDALADQGVSRWVPTVITDSVESLEHKCRVLATALADPALARHIPGIHLEGPFISPDDGPRGAHPRDHVLLPDVAVFNRLRRAAADRICCLTLAPEQPGAMRLIRAARKCGIVVALGHHAAETRHIQAATDAGARLCTHLGNGMAPQIHRHQNALWPQLAEDRLYASFIADLEHVPPPVLRVFARAKGPERIILTSDSVFLAGMKPGRYRMFGAVVDMRPGGRVCLAGTELLAGSSLMLLQGVWNMYMNSDLTL